jgi:hypothetical protein
VSASRRAKGARSLRRHPVVASLTAAGIVALGITGAVRHAELTVPYLVIVLALGTAVAIADDRTRFSRVAIIGLAVWAVLHLAGGLIELDDGRTLYNTTFTRWIHFDNVVHVIGFGSAGLAATEALIATLGALLPRRTTWVVTWVAAMGAGALNEVVEFAASHLLNAANVGGYQNTGRDLVANLIGGAIAASWAARAWPGSTRLPTGR